MYRLNFWAQSFMGHTGLPFSGPVDPRYGCLSNVPPALPPPPMSMLYTSSAPALLLPESLCRRSVVGFSDDSDKSSPELNDSLVAETSGVRSMSPQVLSRHRQFDGAEPTSSAMCQAGTATHQLNYPSLLLHSQLEALRQYHQQQHEQVFANIATESKSRPRCSTAAESPSNSEISAFRQPRKRRATPEHTTADSGTQSTITGRNTPDRTSLSPLRVDIVRSPARKTGIHV